MLPIHLGTEEGRRRRGYLLLFQLLFGKHISYGAKSRRLELVMPFTCYISHPILVVGGLSDCRNLNLCCTGVLLVALSLCTRHGERTNGKFIVRTEGRGRHSYAHSVLVRLSFPLPVNGAVGGFTLCPYARLMRSSCQNKRPGMEIPPS